MLTNYYYKEATKEIKEFTKCTKYENISIEKNSLLYYNTGRIMKDLVSMSTFCIPIIDKHNPLAQHPQ